MKRLALLALVLVAACGKDSPTAPTAPAAPAVTRIIRLGGNLSFGGVGIGQVRTDGILTVSNDGNANLQVTGISFPCSAMTALSSTAFAVAPGQTLTVGVRFAPTTLVSCSLGISVSSDATSGTNTIATNATGTLDGVPLFSRNGAGDDIFTLPTYVTRIRVTATYPGFCQNFVMYSNGRLLINIIIGTCSVADTRTPFSGTYAVTGGATLNTEISTGVSWNVTEVRN